VVQLEACNSLAKISVSSLHLHPFPGLEGPLTLHLYLPTLRLELGVVFSSGGRRKEEDGKARTEVVSVCVAGAQCQK